jgi:hypothetical protein
LLLSSSVSPCFVNLLAYVASQVEDQQAKLAALAKAGTMRAVLAGDDAVLFSFLSEPKPCLDGKDGLYQQSLKAEPRVAAVV